MNSSKLGTGTSVEVTHIDAAGIWVLVQQKEYFLSHQEFPWFRHARIDEILQVELVAPEHLRWPVLDVDFCLDSLEHPEAYPLTYH